MMEIIAEVGSNWKTTDDALHSIRMAKESGANVVKFQTYTHRELFGVVNTEAKPLQPSLRMLSNIANLEGIEFMCTAFSVAGYEIVDQFVQRHKIASSEITAVDLLETVNSFRKHAIVSTGGATYDEIQFAVSKLKNCPITLMHCVVDYPARIVDFRHLDMLRARFGWRCAIGYSDHSNDVLNIPILAESHGATVLEKHVNFTSHTDTPDAPNSLSGEEFKLMVQNLRGEIPVESTVKPNPWKRKLVTLPDGSSGYYRPLPELT